MENEQRTYRHIRVLLAVLAAQAILLGLLVLLIVTGSLPVDGEVILRTWAKTLPRPFVYR